MLVIILVLAVGRAFLPRIVRSYVNRTLNQGLLYRGEIGQVRLHLWRGAYSIDDIRLDKVTGDVPVPLFSCKRLDLRLQWNALLHHRVVGKALIIDPVINFVDAKSDAQSQTGAGGPWLKMAQDLSPFQINRVRVQNGAIHFRSYQAKEPVNVYLSELNATVDNLSNITDETKPLNATVRATAMAMDQAKFDFQMSLDPSSYRPSFSLSMRLLGLDVTKINSLSLAYGGFDFKRGWFDLVVQMNAANGAIQGYVKPLFRDLKVFSLPEDIKQDNPVQFFWQAIVGVTSGVLTNQQRDQFGTRIPFTGSLNTPKPDILATIGNVLRNAFIRAYLPRLQHNGQYTHALDFGAPSMIDQMSIGE